MHYSKPPLDNHLTLAEVVDYNLDKNPHCTYAVLALAQHDVGFNPVHITWLEFARAVHRGAHLINPVVDGKRKIGAGEVIAIFAIADSLLYAALLLAIIRSGNIPLPISNRNTAAAVVNLLEKTSCHNIIFGGGSSLSDVALHVRRELHAKSHEMNVSPLPNVHELFPKLGREREGDEGFVRYPDVGHFNKNETAIILHSSGSTGYPKAIPFSQKYVLDLMSMPVVQALDPSITLGTVGLPPFHMGGWLALIIMPISSGVIITLHAPADPLPLVTPESMVAAMKDAGCDSCFVVPSSLVSWARDDAAVQFLAGMKFVYWGGGPLPIEIGDFLARKDVPITAVYAGTEFAFPTIPRVINRDHGYDPDDWIWLEFMDCARIRWVLQDNIENTYELQILDSDALTPAIHNIDTIDGPGYATSDLFVPHPSKKGLWKIVGRLDDQITLALGEKINPGPIEDFLLQNDLVNGAVLFGRERDQAGTLVEPIPQRAFDPNDATKLSEFRNEIWPTVENANFSSPAFARIFKEMILVTSPDKPLPRTAKGTVIRKTATKQYADEIDDLYAAVDGANGDDVKGPVTWGPRDITDWITANVAELLQRGLGDVKIDFDLFEQGADSLTATYLRNRLISAMRRSPDIAAQQAVRQVGQNVVFSHPTIVSLSAYVVSLVQGLVSPSGNGSPDIEVVVRAMRAMVEKYTANLPTTPRPRKETVLLTGSTGALGSQLLAQMLADKRVEHIWAANRKSSGRSIEERQKQSFEDKELDIELLELSNKLTFVEADLSTERLGLDPQLYRIISSSTTLIIHNAWRLDFNLSLASFESHVKGTRNLIDLAHASPLNGYTRVFFTSSIGTVLSWRSADAVPEEPIADTHTSVGNGYGESKYVSEKILEAATIRSGVPTTVFRVGQLSGGSHNNGAWATTDWVPIILATSVQLRCLPDAVGTISWVPLDVAASAILDVGLERNAPLHQTLHLFHPRPILWTTAFEAMATALEPITNGKRLPLVPFSEWFKMLEDKSVGASSEDIIRIPGLKLLDFYRHFAEGDKAMRAAGSEAVSKEVFEQASLATEITQRTSSAMRMVEPLSAEDARRWIAYWKSKGLFGN